MNCHALAVSNGPYVPYESSLWRRVGWGQGGWVTGAGGGWVRAAVKYHHWSMSGAPAVKLWKEQPSPQIQKRLTVTPSPFTRMAQLLPPIHIAP